MKFGLSVPNVGIYGDTRVLVRLAQEAERAGWDGFFLWDVLDWPPGEAHPGVEPWTCLAAAAVQTSAIALGVMITPITRRRVQVLARQVATVSNLAPGRVVFGAGLGASDDIDFKAFGEVVDRRTRARMLDASLQALRALWSGERVSFAVEHIDITDAQLLPAVSDVPIWIGGRWPNKGPFLRAARYDGVFIEREDGAVGPTDVAEVTAFCAEHGAKDGFSVVVGGATQAGETIDPGFAEKGASWFVEYLFPERGDLATMSARVQAGPPKA